MMFTDHFLCQYFFKKIYGFPESRKSNGALSPKLLLNDINPVSFNLLKEWVTWKLKFIQNLGLENEHLRGSPASGFLKSSEKPQFPVVSRDSSEIYTRD